MKPEFIRAAMIFTGKNARKSDRLARWWCEKERDLLGIETVHQIKGKSDVLSTPP
jgi:hypothetical protein